MENFMITFYGHGSPNPHKVAIALEELQLPYEARLVDIWSGEQFDEHFVAVSPNSKVPVIIDHENKKSVYESNAILLYLAKKTGQLLPNYGDEYWEAIKLLFLQASAIGPMFGQRAWFTMFAPDKPQSAQDRFLAEADRLELVLDRLLIDREFFLTSGYSIVDIAMFGWLHCSVAQGFPIDKHAHLAAWFARIAARPAVVRGIEIPLPLPDFSSMRPSREQRN
jgi:GST-like protein